MTLLEVAESLYNEASSNFHSMDHDEVKQAFECLYAGLELVLPTAIEVKFRILLARLLTRVNQMTRSREQLQKCHQLIQKDKIPSELYWETVVVEFLDDELLPSPSLMRRYEETREMILHEENFQWWMQFDWLASIKGFYSILEDSRVRLISSLSKAQLSAAQLAKLWNCYLLTTFVDASQEIYVDLEQQIMALATEGNPSNSTILTVAGLKCLRNKLIYGSMAEAHRLWQVISPLVGMANGNLPVSFLSIDVDSIKQAWGRLSATMSLRVGEPASEIVKELIPKQHQAYQALKYIDDWRNLEDGPIPTTKYEEILKRLVCIQNRLGDIAQPNTTNNNTSDSVQSIKKVLCQLRELVVKDCPQLESLKLLLQARAEELAGEPAHHIKVSLLEALKIVNNVSHDAQMKAILLLAGGRLYEQTDFDLCRKMNFAALTTAQRAGWDFLVVLAARAIRKVAIMVGAKEEAEAQERLITIHQSRISNPRLLQILNQTTNGSWKDDETHPNGNKRSLPVAHNQTIENDSHTNINGEESREKKTRAS